MTKAEFYFYRCFCKYKNISIKLRRNYFSATFVNVIMSGNESVVCLVTIVVDVLLRWSAYKMY